MRNMISTTTTSIEGRRIVEYKGIVFGEVISGVNFVRDIAASFSNFFGGRSNSYEQELVQARENALREKGIVFGEVISGVNFVRDIAASFSNFFGGRSNSYEQELVQARENALREMEQRAASLGANAVVGVDIDYEVLGADNGMLMVTASGTAVVAE